ncbi:MAG TPA: hypothetical protein VFU37_03055 [Pyrinomonadaceae bacterium]|nr:hypothetical protein [Pyrinomonadaceae bacterium]
MDRRESLRAVENLRFRFQMNNRLRLECLAAISKVFRDFREPLSDELLSSIVFAIPEELVASNGHSSSGIAAKAGTPPQKPYDEPGVPPEKPYDAPGVPPQKPYDEPGVPPEKPYDEPGVPPEKPDSPGTPPQSPKYAAHA